MLIVILFYMMDSAKARYQILVVDDEPTVCKAVQMMLKYYGHDVQIAADGKTALALFENRPFDLVITDYLMPEMRGDQLVTQIKRCRPGQRIIMITAFAADFLVEGKPTGEVDCVLNKPFSLEELRSAIAKVMA
jgi:CheY-like chemotaxis protein